MSVSPLSGISWLSLTFDSSFPSPLLLFSLVLMLFLSCHFAANGPFPWLFFFLQKMLYIFRLFLYGSCWAAKTLYLVGGMCSLLPYGTGICHYTFILFIWLFLSIPFIYFSLIWHQYSRWNGWRYHSVLALCAPLNGGNIEGTKTSQMCVLFYVCVGNGFVDWLEKTFIHVRRVLKCAFTYDGV